VRVLLISTYDMGRQPFGLASPAAWLLEAGVDVRCVDLAKEKLSDETIRGAGVIGFFLPMHTATRLALPVIDRVRAANPCARLVAFGLYAPLNDAPLRDRGITDVLGGEFEEDLVRIVSGPRPEPRAGRPSAAPARESGAASSAGNAVPGERAPSDIPRLQFRVPARDRLLPLARYATLQVGDERRTVGYTEASRGCKHRCRHCPIVPVYNGRFRIVPPDIVLADVAAQVKAGARHITFGDPDFFNGIRHAEAVLRGFAAQFPQVTYDVTIKVEHLLRHQSMLPFLRDTGCAFVTSAVESIDDEVLRKIEKGHTAADFERVVTLCRAADLPLAPTFMPFTPWTTLAGYIDFLRAIDRLQLVEHVSPIQLAIRLLIPEGSRMLELDEIRAVTSPFDPSSLTYPWKHPDPAVDRLQAEVTALVGVSLSSPRSLVFSTVWDLAHERAGILARRRQPTLVSRSAVPYLNEPWYC
jgi:radical SAM superfamily enzyme YgiQ (UPF0313 family)